MLDVLTTYGTQVFWPFSNYPLIVGSVFIIDPLYTVPLASGLLVGLRWSHTARTRRLANGIGLALSTAYLVFTLGNKLWVKHVFTSAVASQGIEAAQVFTKPSAFNNILWTGVAEAPDGFYVGLYSLLDDDTQIHFRYVPKNHDLLGDAAGSKAVARLRWFSRGYYAVSRGPEGHLRVHDLRFPRSDLGLTDSGEYVFTFRLLRGPDGRVTGFAQTRPSVNASGTLLRRFVERIKGNEQAATASRGGDDTSTF
jgi:inner membrane protein